MQALPRALNPCSRCALEHNGPLDSLCGQCLVKPPHFEQCIAAFDYEFPIRQLLSRYKYGKKWRYAKLLHHLLWHRFSEHIALRGATDAIVAVPLHRRRLRQRGFNQALELARFLSQQSGIPLIHPLVIRCRNTPRQQGLTLKQRQKNLKGAFQLRDPVPHISITLVDDVVTSGTTVNEITRLLLKAGASRVDVCCLARTPSPH
ncbi:ComF family protein [Aestuariirhabdus sp. Z084]|uniref:ComF family protein n=1 Tax=Aestuariirhabdus haliotis TaxID=2918751 RepID=UPI00201B449D|nr:ComF family protein [Aestuariirhabdus haliotis]MCL6414941.1 ComF family protein [Aestuariirhabdus haliotis]MCL6418873.1 ComF family protein [Aestuariirhabdus haliotis]